MRGKYSVKQEYDVGDSVVVTIYDVYDADGEEVVREQWHGVITKKHENENGNLLVFRSDDEGEWELASEFINNAGLIGNHRDRKAYELVEVIQP